MDHASHGQTRLAFAILANLEWLTRLACAAGKEDRKVKAGRPQTPVDRRRASSPAVRHKNAHPEISGRKLISSFRPRHFSILRGRARRHRAVADHKICLDEK